MSFEITLFARPRGLGEAVVETLFRLPLEEDRSRNRRPDVAFVSTERWPIGTPQPTADNAWDVVPDLVVEVVSPSDYFEESLAKVAEYFRAGVRLVWIVLPTLRRVLVFEAPEAVRMVAEGGHLEGGDVLPGFRLALASLVDPLPPAAPV